MPTQPGSNLVRGVLVVAAITFVPAPALAQASGPASRGQEPHPLDILQGRPDEVAPSKLVGERFESKSTGLAFNPPAGMQRKSASAAHANHLASFVDDKRGWQLIAMQGTLAEPMPLSSAEIDATEKNAPAKVGLLEQATEEIKATYPAATILRQKVIRVGPHKQPIALLAARLTADLKPVLSQQAIVQADDRTYFTISLTTPIAKPVAEIAAAQPNDALEKAATDAFHATLDTVELLDLRAVKDDQDQRLFRTRALYVNLTPTRLQNAVIAEQWLRIIRNGKDVGYSYVIEEKEIGEDRRKPQDGIRVGVRTRLFAQPPGKTAADAIASPDVVSIAGIVAATGARVEAPLNAAATQPARSVQIDAETWMWTSLDRRHEEWSSVTLIDDGSGERDHTSEVGSSDRQVTHMLDDQLKTGEKIDPRQPPVRRGETYSLNVRNVAKRNAPAPIERALPPFYLPQAIAHFLPRLLPLNEPKGYMFAAYVGGELREVMTRYVDVGPEQGTELGGKKLRAVPVRERTGLEGPITTHWMSADDGRYLGSTCPDAGLVVLATDAADLEKIWEGKADLTRPAQPAAVDK